MAQSLNKTVEFHTTGVSYLGVGGKVGKILVGNAAFEFYADANVEDYIQIPWQEIDQIGAKISLCFKRLWKNFKDCSGTSRK